MKKTLEMLPLAGKSRSEMFLRVFVGNQLSCLNKDIFRDIRNCAWFSLKGFTRFFFFIRFDGDEVEVMTQVVESMPHSRDVLAKVRSTPRTFSGRH